MPEIIGHNPQVEKVASSLRTTFASPGSKDVSNRIENLLQRNEISYSGEESVLFQKGEESKLIALDHSIEVSVDEAKVLYYGHKVFSTLFPFNFPRFHYSSGVENGPLFQNYAAMRNTGTVRENMYPSEEKKIEYPFENVQKFCEEVSVPYDMLFDLGASKKHFENNFKPGRDGGQYYLDKMDSLTLQDIDTEKVGEWMRDNAVVDRKTHEERKYTEKEIEDVTRWLDRSKSYTVDYVAADFLRPGFRKNE